MTNNLGTQITCSRRYYSSQRFCAGKLACCDHCVHHKLVRASVATRSFIEGMMRSWRRLTTRQRWLVGAPPGASAVSLAAILFRGQISDWIIIASLIGAFAMSIVAARLRAEDSMLNPQRFAGKLRYDDTTGRARLVDPAPSIKTD